PLTASGTDWLPAPPPTSTSAAGGGGRGARRCESITWVRTRPRRLPECPSTNRSASAAHASHSAPRPSSLISRPALIGTAHQQEPGRDAPPRPPQAPSELGHRDAHPCLPRHVPDRGGGVHDGAGVGRVARRGYLEGRGHGCARRDRGEVG